MPFRFWLRVTLTFVVTLMLLVGSLPTRSTAQSTRPNILLIVTDDQRFDTMEYMPRTSARIFNEGVQFTNAYATTPLCCPSRASIFTGMYAHNHGIRDNSMSLNEPTFMWHLHQRGYRTGIVGKYLGYWSAAMRPEFDYWVSFPSTVAPYTNPDLNVNGTRGVVQGYATHIYRDHAINFLRHSADDTQPWALVLTPNAPHEPAEPAPEDADLYADLPPFRPPSYDEADTSDKSLFFQSQPRMTAAMAAETDALRRKQLQSLHAVDDMVDQVMDQLEQSGDLDNTLVVYMSDNGLLWGEHGREGKKLAYEESVHVPLAIRYPPLVGTPRIEANVVGNIDIAPTIYDLAGIPRPSGVDGESLVPLLRGDTAGVSERALLLEGWNANPWIALRYDRWMLIDTKWDRSELYDMLADPYQMTNLADDPAHAQILLDLRQRLVGLAEPVPAGDDTGYRVVYDEWRPVVIDDGGFRTTAVAGQTASYTTPISTTSLALITARGPAYGKAQITIDNTDMGVHDFYAPVEERGVVLQFDNLSRRTHRIHVRVLGQKHADSTAAAVVVDGFKVGAVTIDDQSPSVTFGGWGGSTEASMRTSGGSYRRASTKNAKVSWQFTGTQFTWRTALGPQFGKANVMVDGVVKTTVDLYAPTKTWGVPITIEGLPAQSHVVTIVALGTKNPSSQGTVVPFDGWSTP